MFVHNSDISELSSKFGTVRSRGSGLYFVCYYCYCAILWKL